MSVDTNANSPPTEQRESHQRSSLLVRQTAFVCLMVLLTSAVLTLAAYYFAGHILRKMIQEQMWTELSAVQHQLNARIYRQGERLNLLGRNSELCRLLDDSSTGDMPEDQFYPQALAILNDFQGGLDQMGKSQVAAGRYLEIALVDVNGETVVSTSDDFPQGALFDDPVYVLGRSEFVMLPPERSDDRLYVRAAAPFYTKQRRLFVAMVLLEAAPMLQCLMETNDLDGERVMMVTPRDDSLYLLNGDDRKVIQYVPIGRRAWLEHATTRTLQFDEVQGFDEQPWFAVGRPLGFQNWGVVATVPVDAAFESLGRMKWMLWGLALGTLVAAGILAYGVSYRITRPLRQLVKFAGHVAQGELSQRIPVESDDEVGALAQALNAMAERLQSS
jgi:HAMP domain-containing protein